jgi:amidophosphoribosyltransferase
MCGIVGVVSKSSVNQDLFDALTVLQHRGQDSAGMATCEGNKLFLRKGNGLVRDVIRTEEMLALKGNIGIGHLRYPTAGSLLGEESQPFYVNSPYGITLAHNGNLINTHELAHDLSKANLRHINTTSDSELLLNVFAYELQRLGKVALSHDDIFEAISAVHRRCRGAYAVIAMITGYGIVAFRDPHGIRPLIYGKRKTGVGTDYMVASESVALNSSGFEPIADVVAGEAIFITEDGKFYQKQCAPQIEHRPCLFEYVYLARPDSIIDKISVYKVRLRMGEQLAEKILSEYPNHDIDVVMPIPETSRTAAMTLAHRLGLKYREGFVKNVYIGRTFIMPGQTLRKKSVRQKLNTIPLEFKDKNVLLVDDSIVRGTTSKEIIQMARDAGANKVYFASAAPEIRHPNIYGIDIPVAEELIAHNKTTAEICRAIGADWLVFQDLHALVEAAREGNSEITEFEDSVFTGKYAPAPTEPNYFENLAKKRGCG